MVSFFLFMFLSLAISQSVQSTPVSQQKRSMKKGFHPEDECIKVGLIGTLGGPIVFDGRANSGSLISTGKCI